MIPVLIATAPISKEPFGIETVPAPPSTPLQAPLQSENKEEIQLTDEQIEQMLQAARCQVKTVYV